MGRQLHQEQGQLKQGDDAEILLLLVLVNDGQARNRQGPLLVLGGFVGRLGGWLWCCCGVVRFHSDCRCVFVVCHELLMQ